jgi:hypothetical protein
MRASYACAFALTITLAACAGKKRFDGPRDSLVYRR